MSAKVTLRTIWTINGLLALLDTGVILLVGMIGLFFFENPNLNLPNFITGLLLAIVAPALLVMLGWAISCRVHTTKTAVLISFIPTVLLGALLSYFAWHFYGPGAAHITRVALVLTNG